MVRVSCCEGKLTSVEVMDKIRSRSSTSCLKVGLCDGMACQHSLMIMYLKHTSGYSGLYFSDPEEARRVSGFLSEWSLLYFLHVQLVCAVGRFVHPVSLFQQLEEFFHWDPWVRRAPQGEDFPQQNAVGPPAREKHNQVRESQPKAEKHKIKVAKMNYI